MSDHEVNWSVEPVWELVQLWNEMLIYYEFKRKLYFQGEKSGSMKSSFYVSLSVFCRLAVLVDLFLSCLKTERNMSVTKQLQLYDFKWGCHLYCGRHPFYFLFFRTCWQSSKFTTNHLCLTLHFPSRCRGLAEPLPMLGGCAEQEDCSEPLSMSWGSQMPSVAKPSRGVTQVREKCWECGSILILY